MGERVAALGYAVTDATSRVAFVTGGSRGIGRATAAVLAGHGHRVALCYSQDEAGAKETVVAIEATGGSALAVCAAVDDAAAVDAAFTEIEAAFGPVEILVNNAGHHPRRSDRPHDRRQLGRACSASTSPARSTRSAARSRR